MPFQNSPQYQRTGSFVQTTQMWNTEDEKELLVRLYQQLNTIALVLNTKSTGANYLQEFVTGDLWFPNPANATNTPPVPMLERQSARIVVNFGPLPGGAIPNPQKIPHNLSLGQTWSIVKINGYATNPLAVGAGRFGIPIPYVAVANDPNDNLELWMDSTYVWIQSGGTDYSAFTTTVVIIEFLTV
jgi:hypothetical protein